MLDADTDDLDADKEPSAPLKDLIAEIKRDVSASALLNIPGSTPRNTDAPTLTSQRMSWSMLLQFFSERAEKATIIAKSPRKKTVISPFQTPQEYWSMVWLKETS